MILKIARACFTTLFGIFMAHPDRKALRKAVAHALAEAICASNGCPRDICERIAEKHADRIVAQTYGLKIEPEI